MMRFEISSKRVHILGLEPRHTTMAIEQMQRANKHTNYPQMKFFDHLGGTMQANANLCFTHMLTITFPALGLHERDH